MQKVISNITMSLDGFIAGPGISSKQPMGENGIRLHKWIFDGKTEKDTEILNHLMEATGAVIVGNHTYTTAIETAWDSENPFPAGCFVICHKAPAKSISGFTYITDGIDSALAKARLAAGDKYVWVMGGANIIQQYLKAKLIDSLTIHIVPLLLVNGTRLFEPAGMNLTEMKKISTIDTPEVTHIEYEIVR